MYYTYLWLREDGTPYYVGKGHGDRAYKVHRSSTRRMVAPPKERIVIYLAESEADAFETEVALVWYYGRKDLGLGCLRNLSDGGEGPAGRPCTDSAKELIRLSLKAQGITPPSRANVPHKDSIKKKISASMFIIRSTQPKRASSCHPDRLHYGRGLCRNCYRKERRKERRTQA